MKLCGRKTKKTTTVTAQRKFYKKSRVLVKSINKNINSTKKNQMSWSKIFNKIIKRFLLLSYKTLCHKILNHNS
jgi:predicted metallo-beta-lactamase superfamily hydrolase